MRLTKSFEILKINLSFDYNIFIVTKIVNSLFRFRKIFFIFFHLIIVISKWKMTII